MSFKIIEDRFGARFIQTESFKPIYSVSAFTFPSLPVISNEDTEHINLMRWGLIPFWVKDQENANSIREKTLNSRAETIFEKPAFRNSIQARRCLVLVNGFFEWRHINNQTYPYYIRLINQAPFALAGIWDNWTNPQTKETVKSFSVITTKANILVEKIHNTQKRMPVILPRDKERIWIQAYLEQNEIQSLLQPYDASQMEAYAVSKLVNKLGYNTTNPEVTTKQDYSDLPNI